MPRKTKEQTELENKTTKKATSKSTTKKTVAKKVAKTEAKKDTATKKKTASTKKATTTKKKTSSTASAKKTTKKTSTKKSTAKKTTKKSTTKKKTTTSRKKTTSKKKVEIVEYYDLPYRYNQTIVKVLAQTPTTLFVYWDISDKDRNLFKEKYGENFFEITKPVLVVKNNTLGYSFEVEINDFANSWYLHVADSKCDYDIELGRRPISSSSYANQNIQKDEYIYIAKSNDIESPNDRILFNKNQNMVYFRNVKTNATFSKPISSISFIRNMGKIYNIYDLYKKIYKDENIDDIYDLSNPSSMNPSSRKYSSKL